MTTPIQPDKQQSSLGSKIGSTVLLIAVPQLLLVIIGALGGGFAIGMPELALLSVIWLVGLIWIWRPRRTSSS